MFCTTHLVELFSASDILVSLCFINTGTLFKYRLVIQWTHVAYSLNTDIVTYIIGYTTYMGQL